MSFFLRFTNNRDCDLSTLRRFEGCLPEVEGWLKTGNKGRSFQAWLSRKALPTFLPVLLIRDKAECHLIKDITMRKLLISPAKMTQLSLSIAQHLARWPPFFISLLQSPSLREHLYKIWEKSIWYFYHARATDLIDFRSPGKSKPLSTVHVSTLRLLNSSRLEMSTVSWAENIELLYLSSLSRANILLTQTTILLTDINICLFGEVRVLFPLKVLNSKAGACHNRKRTHCLVVRNLKFHAKCNHQTNKHMSYVCL